MKVPFVDLKIQYESIKTEIDSIIQEVINNTAFIGGNNNKYVTEFEENFASFLGSRKCVTCANGTDSIEIILKALGIGIGDEVIVPANSWISTSEAVSSVGATPVFVDTLPLKYTIDPNKISEKISSKTKAIIPVHLYGQAADLDEVVAISKKHNLYVIEDCAQSHAAEYKGVKLGTIGIASSFSFYPGKNLGAYGDAGCIVSNDERLAEKCQVIANHGQLVKHNHIMEGRNSRLDGIQAAVLNTKLKYLNQWTDLRIKNAEIYFSILQRNNSIVLPSMSPEKKHVFHLFVVQVDNREETQNKLKHNGIETAIHYPTPLPFLAAYKSQNNKPEDFSVSLLEKSKILSLPMFPELTHQQIEFVCENLK